MRACRHRPGVAYPDGSLDADTQLLVQPDRHLCAGLQELENVVDGRQKHLSTTSASTAAHCDLSILEI